MTEAPAVAARAGTARVIVFNADDYGLSPAVNAGILAAQRAGLVRAASLMTTAPAFLAAVEIARKTPALDLGLHLALTDVRPALPPEQIPSLVEGERFPTLPRFLLRLAGRRIRADEVRRELAAQTALGHDTDLPFSHLDSHHHVHLFRPVAGEVAELARREGIRIVRRIGRDATAGEGEPRSGAKLALLRGADLRAARAYGGLPRTDAFRGIPFPDSFAAWERLLRGLPRGVTEFMCHPGQPDPTPASPDSYGRRRVRELDWLVDPALAALIRRHGITIGDFHSLEAARDC